MMVDFKLKGVFIGLRVDYFFSLRKEIFFLRGNFRLSRCAIVLVEGGCLKLSVFFC